MPTVTLKLPLAEGVRWPQECVVCGAPASSTVRASCSVARNLKYMAIVMEWTRHSISVNYPVCTRHHAFALLMNQITRRSLIHLGIGVVIASYLALAVLVPLGIWIVEGTPPESPTKTLLIALIAAFTLGVFIWTQLSVPVKLEDVTSDRLRIRFGRAAYAAAFVRLNQPAVATSDA